MTLDYLGGSQRLGEGNYWDYYFSCNIQGPNLQWVINGTGYGTYLPGQFDIVFQGSLPTLNYTSFLLSSRTVNRVHLLDSIVIVSVEDNINISVGCVSDVGSDVSSNRDPINNNLMQAQSSDNAIRLFQLWNRIVIQGGNVDVDNTRCFMCGVDSSILSWVINNESSFAFDTQNEIGATFHLLSTDKYFLRLQTILFASSPKRLVSIFLLTDSSVSNILCSAGGISLSSYQLRSRVDEDHVDEDHSTTSINPLTSIDSFEPAISYDSERSLTDKGERRLSISSVINFFVCIKRTLGLLLFK